MVDAKESVSTATSFLNSLYESARDIRLEEVALNSLGITWQVVLSFRGGDSGSHSLPVPGNMGSSANRQTKQVDIDRMSGEARALRAWKSDNGR